MPGPRRRAVPGVSRSPAGLAATEPPRGSAVGRCRASPAAVQHPAEQHPAEQHPASPAAFRCHARPAGHHRRPAGRSSLPAARRRDAAGTARCRFRGAGRRASSAGRRAGPAACRTDLAVRLAAVQLPAARRGRPTAVVDRKAAALPAPGCRSLRDPPHGHPDRNGQTRGRRRYNRRSPAARPVLPLTAAGRGVSVLARVHQLTRSAPGAALGFKRRLEQHGSGGGVHALPPCP